MPRVGSFLLLAAACAVGLSQLDSVFVGLDESRRKREAERTLNARAALERERLMALKSG